MASTNVTAIYSTDYKRTQQTVDFLAAEKGLEIFSYGWSDPKRLLTKMLETHAGGTIVISGHSNTTPILANILLGEEKFQQFDDGDYGNILIIMMTELGKSGLIHLRF